MTLAELYIQLDTFIQTCKETGDKPLIVILGQTASGKTELSIDIAKRVDGEVISTDSRQVYKYMDIGTAKITEEEKKGIKHHLIDIVEPDQPFNLSDFIQKARFAIKEIQEKNKVPMLVGGTGLYISAIVENYKISKAQPDLILRKQLEEEYKKHGAEYLHQKLKKLDPKSAANIHPNNVRYVIRAIEINLATKNQKKDQKGAPKFAVFNIGIDWPRELLYKRINKRADIQIKKGLLEEVQSILDKGYDTNLPSMASIGYQEIIPYLKGKTTLEEAKEILKRNTRRYAKRQMTWFKRYKHVNWLDYSELNKI